MNIATIRTTLENILNTKASSYGETASLSQTHLTDVTDTLAASGLDTVNPNGPHYPSTPR